jgi:hypothetical protein
VFGARTILMVLMVLRLLLPPGICVCEWSSPAARLLIALLNGQRQVPPQQEPDDDDHAPGCPASPLAVGMGVRPPSELVWPPALSLDPLPPLQAAQPFAPLCCERENPPPIDLPHSPLYLTLRALLL